MDTETSGINEFNIRSNPDFKWNCASLEILKPVTQPLFDFSWVISAFKEAISQPTLKRKLKHLKYRLLWELRPLFKWAGKYPLAVDVELASYCNFRCVFCQQASNWWNKTGETVPQSFMPWETFTKIVDECAQMGVFSMKINWRGEPMANPHFIECIKYMKSKGIHEVMMNTNASYISADNCLDLLFSGIDRIIFSCDGVSKETYNTIRKGGDWDVFIEKLKLFEGNRRSLKKSGFPVPKTRINTAVMEENIHEIPKFKEIFSPLVDELRFNTLYNPQSKNKFLGDRKRHVKRRGCAQIYQRMIVAKDGKATVCCADYEQKLAVGNANDKRLSSLYQNEQEEIRKTHESHLGRQLEGCKKCDLFSLSEYDANGEVIWN